MSKVRPLQESGRLTQRPSQVSERQYLSGETIEIGSGRRVWSRKVHRVSGTREVGDSTSVVRCSRLGDEPAS